MGIPTTTVDQLVARYDAFLLDAYGVIVNQEGALPGAAAFLEALGRSGRPYFVLTNDASRRAETWAGRFAAFGLPVPGERIVTSGSLVAPYFREHGLAGAPTVVLGTDDSREEVRQAGGRVVAFGDDGAVVVVVSDDEGYPLLDALNATFSMLCRRLDAGKETHLLVPNPDLFFPRATGEFAVTAGALAHLLDTCLERRYGDAAPRFLPLGKPHPPIFEEGIRRARAPRRRIVMIGDQLETDIAGARGVGLDAVLITGGVSRSAEDAPDGLRPTYLLPPLGEPPATP